MQPLRQRTSFQPNSGDQHANPAKEARQRLRLTRHLGFARDFRIGAFSMKFANSARQALLARRAPCRSCRSVRGPRARASLFARSHSTSADAIQAPHRPLAPRRHRSRGSYASQRSRSRASNCSNNGLHSTTTGVRTRLAWCESAFSSSRSAPAGHCSLRSETGDGPGCRRR